MALKIPLLLYGTAWKEERTAHLTETAVLKGFTCIDTANYPTAYNEKLTGDGIAAALKSGVKRRDLFIYSHIMLRSKQNSRQSGLTIRSLGVSNFKLPQIKEVYANATVKPVIVQNRFYKETSFDVGLREFCAERAVKLNVEKELAFYVLILGLGGIQILDGTTNPERMAQDLKTVGEVFGNKRRLRELQTDFDAFRQLLSKLSTGAE
ncbi:hypothetical protein M431DRAFT_478776 [Trichoderma harzianum CBS 226.95]|uniref:NADP-dependent oxidoreductase domain-containing protein n=1 Tax=Trichoderma harzianum CBS 226.95 TaxID=983964 RepID=A0A2T4ARQ4_TRIHA|nr:hypothetical protein M431DRAFT_478776 [Trichoderma harzianum CBS 226.95]PTB59751.1 hypothetical protein M431DRAFT_478776 [Trichoderma harzianum CBS 226.95]